MVDFRDYGRWNDQSVLFSLEKGSRSLVPGIVAIVKGIQNSGVEQDRHSILTKARAPQNILGALGGLLFPTAKRAATWRQAARTILYIRANCFADHLGRRLAASHRLELEEDLGIRIEIDGRALHSIYVSIYIIANA